MMSQTDIGADRQAAILNAAFHSFAAYGFRRTSMEDIATAAGLSRTALYLHFKSKEDIFRSLSVRYFEEALRDMAAELGRTDRSPAQTMQAAFVAKDGKFMDVVFSTPHGRELLDAGFSISADLAKAGEVGMARLLTAYFARHHIAPGVGSAEDLAQTLTAALWGLKGSATSLASYRDGQALLAALFAMALTPAPDHGGTAKLA